MPRKKRKASKNASRAEAKGKGKGPLRRVGRILGIFLALLGALLLTLLWRLHAGGKLPPTPFDGERAMRHVEALVAFGPRPAGSKALAKSRTYIVNTLEALGLTVERDPFVAQTPRGPIPMENLIVRLPGARPRAIAFASHYDTKFFPHFTFVGANDGGSSTGVLLELARVLATRRLPVEVWLLFFDGEEAQRHWTKEDSLYGSRHFVATHREMLERLDALVLIDMIGDRDLELQVDLNSSMWLVQRFWNMARRMGYGRHFGARVTMIEDDHLPFREAGIDAIDLIDFSYGPKNRYWHRPEDTLDKLSPQSLEVIGDLLVHGVEVLANR